MMFLNNILTAKLFRSAVIILGVVVIGVYITADYDRDALGKGSIIQNQERWAEIIKKDGASQAYGRFFDEYQNEPFGVQHDMAHIFGEMLFEIEGVNGISICDDSFAYGCYHGFFSVAISLEGSSIISAFDTVCEGVDGSPSACRHGIGHGIMEYSGPNKLNEALELCGQTTWSGPIGGCLSGVFMEYNVPLVRNEAGEYEVSPRPLKQENPYFPCNSVEDTFKQSCFHELPHWWVLVYEKDYKKIGLLCEEINEPILRESCFIGMGNIIAPMSDYSVEETKDICRTVSSEEGEKICLLSAGRSFSWNPKGKEYANELCRDIPETSGMVCPH